MTLKQTPSQTVGPYFAYGLVPTQYAYDFPSLFDNQIAGPDTPGEIIRITGQVFDGKDQPIGDAMLELSQPDASGRFLARREDVQPNGFRGFGRHGTGTLPGHRFEFHTIKPGSIGPGNAPFINVILTMRGMLVHAFTRIYFDDEAAANEKDEVLATVPAQRRSTLIARRDKGSGATVYRFDLHMQGPQETVFFDV